MPPSSPDDRQNESEPDLDKRREKLWVASIEIATALTALRELYGALRRSLGEIGVAFVINMVEVARNWLRGAQTHPFDPKQRIPGRKFLSGHSG